MAHDKGSFNYKTINPIVKGVLDTRSVLNNTVQVAMPFIKATTTIRLPEYLGDNNIGFTLGMHATQLDMNMEDMYSSREGNAMIGYTYGPDGKNQAVYTYTATDAEIANSMFSNGTDLVNDTLFSRIPPPGITKMTIGRNKNGLLVAGEIEISVPILSQLEALHRVFLVPGIGMIMEWGQQFAEDNKENFGERGLIASDKMISSFMFPWYDQTRRNDLFQRLALNKVGLEEILTNYVYPTQGQYMWMFGRVANFSTKANSDGSYTCNVKIVGPSEDAWAYSTRNTVIPPRSSNDAKICPDGANSVESFFSTTSNGTNLKTLLESTMGGNVSELSKWKSHVKKFDKTSNKEGQPNADGSKPSVTETSFADSEDSYFMTWRFFVNVVLNDEKFGIKSIFKNARMTPDELKKIAFLRSYIDSTAPYINDEYENYVGNNKFLRSVDPSVMIIVNENAAKEAENDTLNSDANKQIMTKKTDKTAEFLSAGDFNLSVEQSEKINAALDRGFLSTGVWLNHKAVVQSMVSSDTILRGIINLLDRMNSATMGYWQLTVDASEPSYPNTLNSSMNYTVIDANFRESAEHAVSNFIDKVHVFNKYIRERPDGTRVGSDVIDCSVDLSLPKRLFSQIATMGLVQPNDVKAANGGVEDPAQDGPIIGDPNETLRKMFAITSITPKTDEDGPDLTVLSRKQRASLASNSCNNTSGQTTAGTAGVGARPAPPNAADAQKSPEELKKLIEARQNILKTDKCASAYCKSIVNKALEAAPPMAATPIPSTGKTVKYIGQSGNTVTVEINTTFKGDSANAQALYAAGYRNGQVPASSFVRIGQGSHALYKDAAEKFIEMVNAALQDDVQLTVTDTYRPLYGNEWSQVGCVQSKGYYSGEAKQGYDARQGSYGWCARPGTSNHGWGLAVDLNVKKASNITPWLNANAAKYGFTSIPNEPWHWEYTKQFSLKQPIAAPPAAPPAATPAVSPKNIPPRVSQTPNPSQPLVDCGECVQAQKELNQYTTQNESNEKYNQGKDRVTRQFPGLEQVFRYVEPYGDIMVANITRGADGNKSNAFGASPGTLSISADITLPGINGLRVGELFWIDRIPTFYKAFGAFQTLSIEDTIDKEGWKTQIHARFNYMGNLWKTAMANRLRGAIAASTVSNALLGIRI